MGTDDADNNYRKRLEGDLFNVKLLLEEANAYKKQRFHWRGFKLALASAGIVGGIYYLQHGVQEAFLFGATIGGISAPALYYLSFRRLKLIDDLKRIRPSDLSDYINVEI